MNNLRVKLKVAKVYQPYFNLLDKVGSFVRFEESDVKVLQDALQMTSFLVCIVEETHSPLISTTL